MYINANVGYLYGDNITEVKELDLRDPNLIRDLEVVNQEQLEAKILSFVDTGKILPAGIIIVLSSAYTFDKNFENPATPQQYAQIQSFLSTVPFEDIYSRTYEVGKSSKVIAVNKSFCDALIMSFEKLKFTFYGVVPFQIVQSFMPEFAEKVDLKLLYGKFDELKQYRVFTLEKEVAKEAENTNKTDTKNKRLMIFIGIFIFLLIILSVVIINTFFIHKSMDKANNVSASPIERVILPTPSPLERSASGSGLLNQ